MFFPKAEELARTAAAAEEAGERDKAREYYLRSSAVYRIARFPAPRSARQREAWRAGKDVFYRGAALMEYPIREVRIPHTHRVPLADVEGAAEGAEIPVNYLAPPGASAASRCPLVLIITGLDGYRTELAVWQRGWLDKGVATVVAEIPGTGDSPARAADPRSPDRLWSSVLDWIAARPEIDAARIVVWGFSTGGYYALRAAHTHADRLLGCVSQGGGAHHMFDPAWLARANTQEYPFDLADTLAHKWGYPDLASFAAEAQMRFSLVVDGTLDRRACCRRVLLVNGKLDSIFPVEDVWVALEHGAPKEARVVAGRPHMGEPESFVIILRWIHALLGLDGDIDSQLRGLPSRMKY